MTGGMILVEYNPSEGAETKVIVTIGMMIEETAEEEMVIFN